MGIRDLITAENVVAYAKAGIDVARATRRLHGLGYDSLIVPSRGAVPVLRVAQSYYRSVVQPLMTPEDRIAKGLPARFGPLTMALDVPFTADAGRMGVDGLTSAQIRRFWARVVAAIVRRRSDDPNYRLFRFVRDEACRVGFHPALEWRFGSERFIFIDTVVSGRAVAEIADAFDAEGLDQVHYLLLLDEEGRAMRAPYDRRIHALAAAGRATLVPVPSLFTEDQGPSVSGVWSVVVPALMDVARDDPLFSDGVVGAGVFYHETPGMKEGPDVLVRQAAGQLHTMLFGAMHVAADPEEVAQDLDDLKSGFGTEHSMDHLLSLRDVYGRSQDHMLRAYLDHVEENRLFNQRSTLAIAEPRILAGTGGVAATVDASSSHCLRLHMGKDDAARLMASFRNLLRKPYWADEEHTERA